MWALGWWGKGCKRGLGAAVVHLEGVQQMFHRSTPLPVFGAFWHLFYFFCWKLLVLFWL